MNDREERDLLAFAEKITRYERPATPAPLRAQLRGSLLAAPYTPARAAPTWARLPALRPIAVGLVVVALLIGGGSFAAAGSLPGDPAFALKRAAEEAQVALTRDDAGQLDLRVTQTDSRVSDLRAIAESRPSALSVATEEYLAAVARMDQALSTVLGQTATAARNAAIARAAQASAAHIALLRALAATLPAQAQPGIQRAIDAQETSHGRSSDPKGRPAAPGSNGAPAPGGTPTPSGAPAPGGRPSEASVPPGRGGPPSGVPGRP